ncbi:MULTISPECIES: hypothetical protein [unclassified Rhizobium]|uniref:hypothetical protein n=1 Tax=unclassified Rhizobium TaxID=2613769 RepID=UPI00105022A0|nr:MULTISPECIES: hypothetical protein [unclassified Rhizobium]MBB3399616.1 membrane protein implicated in regulation of membrane protease activity [Rhizobium sp. BK060]MBB4172115.1 membrane protein implicated in regulation of membrane protease activity [Rhizobium sp. BK538]TCM63765.1 hypothetical protein EV291_1487 [Rhizobium sp. BK068]
MGWALVISFLIGAVCALRVPVLIFTLIVLVVMIAYAGASYFAGSPVLNAFAWGFVFAVVLEAGYVFAHVVLHAFYARRASDTEKRAPQQAQPKYPAD